MACRTVLSKLHDSNKVADLIGTAGVRCPIEGKIPDLIGRFPNAAGKIDDVVKSFPSLYSRQWLSNSVSTSLGDYKRSFRVMQFNVLAEGLSADPGRQPPFETTLQGTTISPSDFGGFDTTEESLIVFDYHNFRKWRLLQEILRTQPHILALEEVDHFPDFFEPVLASVGYKGIFQPKANSPCTAFGYYSDGVALFWKHDTFEALPPIPAVPEKAVSEAAAAEGDEAEGAADNAAAVLDSPTSLRSHPAHHCTCTRGSAPSVHVVVPLRHLESGHIITFAATHLKAKASEEFETVRENQVGALLAAVESTMKAVASTRCIVMGDFNADPHRTPEVPSPRAVPSALQWRNAHLRSAYMLPTAPGSGLYTTWKSRTGHEVQHIIDYIFYSHTHLSPRAVLGPPLPEEIAQSTYKLPDMRYPSDHIAIAADFDLL